jgi:hypothetical protein
MRSPPKKCVARGVGAAWLIGVLLISVQGAARGAEAVTNALVIAPPAEQSADGALSRAVFPELGSALADGRRRLSYSQLEKLTASDAASGDWFGDSVAIDGGTVVVGSPYKDGYTGAVYVYRTTDGGTTYVEVAKLTAADAASGD